MSDHLSDQQLRALQAGHSPSREAERHLAACVACRARVWALLDVGARIDSVQRDLLAEDLPAHLPYETLERLVSGGASDEDVELARQHLEDCHSCQRELDDLRAFAAEMAAEPSPASEPAARSASGGGESAATAAPGRTPTTRSRHRFVPPWIGIAAGVAAALLGSWWVLEVSPSKPGATARTTPRPMHPRTEPRPQDDAVLLVQDRSGPIRRRAGGSIEGLPAGRFASAVAAVLAGGSLPRSPLGSSLATAPGQLRGATDPDAHVVLQAPVAEVVADDTPEFRWQGTGEREAHVEVFDEDLRQVAGGVSRSGSWSPSAPLSRGLTYVWQLRVGEGSLAEVHPRPPLPPARFHVLSAAAADEVREALASRSHLAAAVVYARHGMSAAAVAELRALQKLDSSSDVPRRLLAELASEG